MPFTKQSSPQDSNKNSPPPLVEKVIAFLVPTQPWLEKIVALLALANYILVLFDLSYIPLRDFWLQGRLQIFIKIGPIEQEFPEQPIKILPFPVTDWYDWVKGIEPYRETEQYLQRVEDLNDKINQQALQPPAELKQNGKESGESIDDILKDLQERSIDMVEQNPFQIANKTGTLERIKNKMRQHVFDTEDASAKKSFTTFWSRENLSKKGAIEELNYFNQEIAPLIETNYFRPVGENGRPVDNFGLLDFLFFNIFLIDFLLRTWYISYRYTGVNWFDAMLWRWYDIFLLIPVFRWLRIIPVTIRLNQANLIDLKAIQKQARQGFVASIAEDMTQVVVVQVIDRLQDSVRDGEIRNWLSQRDVGSYIDLNDVNETAEIIRLIVQLTVRQVLPKIKPEAEALLQYNLEKMFNQSSAYQRMQNLPGVKNLETQLAGRLSAQLYQTLLDVLTNLIEQDPVFEELLEKLVAKFSETAGTELQGQRSMEKIESLLTALLEEIKINYVQKLSQKDIEQILEQTRALRQETNIGSV